jgi:hypothetical protein
MTKTLEQQFYGDEPIYKGITPTNLQFAKALNWYNYMADPDKGRGWLLEYLKKNGYSPTLIGVIKEINIKEIPYTDFWIARMALNGAVFPQEILDRLQARLERAAAPRVKEVSRIPTISVQERVKRVNNALITAVEGELDDNPRFSLYKLLEDHQASLQAVEAVLRYYTPHLEEVTSGDPQVAEAYGPRLAFWKKVYKGMIEDCKRFLESGKATKATKPRKPRKLKVKTPADLVRKVKIKLTDPDLKISSVDPQKIIGATHLWVYNTKYRTIGQYVTNSAKGFSVKGTTILNFDPEQSKCRKLRKPQQQLAEFAQQGKVGLRTFLTNIKAKDGKLNGRLNIDILLLKAT